MSLQHTDVAARAQGQLYAVDLLRFVAAMLVVLYHYGSAFPLAPTPVAQRAFAGGVLPANWSSVTWFGWVGVEIFFVISGFVIAISAQDTTRSVFIRRRVLRLVPTAWICASLTFLIVSGTGIVPPMAMAEAWVRSIAFWPFGVQVDPVYWTLGIEISFYLMIALRLGGGGNARAIEHLAITLGLISTVFWANVMIGTLAPEVPRLAQLLMVQHGCFFALGIMIWMIVYQRLSPFRIIVSSVLMLVCFIEIAGHSIERSHALGLAVNVMLPMGVFVIAVLILFLANAAQHLTKTVIDGFITKTLGLMTYPIYLIHQDAGAVILVCTRSLGWSHDFGRVMAIALILAISLIIVRFGEPLIRKQILCFSN